MNDGMSLWNFAPPREDFGNLAMNAGDLDWRLNDMAHGQYPRVDGGWAEYDRTGLFLEPLHFGLNDLFPK